MQSVRRLLICGVSCVSLLLACLLASTPSQALNVGDLYVASALDEPLQASIPLLSATQSEINSLQTTLAGREEYERAGVNRPEFLNELQFGSARSGDRYFITISSKNAITEPFLHLLVSINWEGGRFLREYTALIDPPLYAAKQAPAPEAVVLEQPVTEIARDIGSSEPVTVAEGDTLSTIIKRLSLPSNVSTTQAITAIVNENPHAFIDGNANLIRLGAELTVPSVEQMTALSPAQAREAYQSQLAVWRQKKESKLLGAAAADSQDASAAETSAASVQTQTEELLKILDTPSTVESAQVPSAESASLAAANEQFARRLSALEEALLSKDLENKALRQRITQLEAQVVAATSAARRAISIEENTLALAQNQAAQNLTEQNQDQQQAIAAQEGTNQISEEAAQDNLAGQIAQEPASQQNTAIQNQQTQPQLDQTAQASSDQVTQQSQAAESVQSQEPAMSESGATVMTPSSGGETESQTALAQTAPATDTSQQLLQETQAEPQQTAASMEDEGFGSVTRMLASDVGSWWDKALRDSGDWLWKALLGILALIVGLVLLILVKRRGSEWNEGAEFDYGDSLMLETGDTTQFQDDTSTLGQTTELSFLLEDSGTTRPGAISTTEVDPLAEAEVYMAYGRDEQAMTVLKNAIESSPSRHELKFKLLEIYSKRNDARSFEELARGLHSNLDEQHAQMWVQVSQMGRALDADNPLYQSALPGGSMSLSDIIDSTLTETTSRQDIGDSQINLDSDTIVSSSGMVSKPVSRASVPLQSYDSQNIGEFLDKPESVLSPKGDDLDIESLDVKLQEVLEDSVPMTQADRSGLVGASAPESTLTGDDSLFLDSEVDADFSVPQSISVPHSMPSQSRDDLTFRLDEVSEDSSIVIETATDKSYELTDLDLDMPVSTEDTAVERGEIESDSVLDEEFLKSLDELHEDMAQEVDQGTAMIEEVDRDVHEVAAATEAAVASAPQQARTLVDDMTQSDSVTTTGTATQPAGASSAGWDESATRLDLARAYIDMGDGQAARGFLEDVVKLGSDAQRQQAQDLLARIGV